MSRAFLSGLVSNCSLRVTSVGKSFEAFPEHAKLETSNPQPLVHKEYPKSARGSGHEA